MAYSPPAKPSVDNKTAPRKNPSPLIAFFDPVNSATHLYSAPCASLGSTSLMALLELILVRSLATPEIPCTSNTYVTETAADQSGCNADSANKAATCILKPNVNVSLSPNRLAIQPPPALVTMPMNS